MISICIPVYNFDVRKLVVDLHQQAIQLKIPFEIILLDDASEDKFIFMNREIAALDHVRWLELPSNLGRSKIRNQLAELAHYTYLLFMDCDSKVVKDDYLKKYLVGIEEKTMVICGGRTHNAKPEDPTLYLRWLYGKKREEKSAAERRKSPNHGFMTNNFLVRKDLFKKIKFNESLKGYGHEDSLFGYELLKMGIAIEHIDNPLAHIGLEPAPVFLAKTTQGVKNLWYIHQYYPDYREMLSGIRLLQAYNFLKKWHLHRLLAIWFALRKKNLSKNLLGPNPDLSRLDWYKLGLLCQYSLQKKHAEYD